jgi:hypothetical protein
MNAPRVARPHIPTDPADYARRLRSAVSDVMDGVVTLDEACAARRVDYDKVRAELTARGWKPVRHRQRRSRARRAAP